MKITKDKSLGVSYLQFITGQVEKTIKVHPDVLVDVNKKGQVLGIEVISIPKPKKSKKVKRKAK